MGRRLEACWGHLGLSWGHLGAFWSHLGASRGYLGAILGAQGAVSEPVVVFFVFLYVLLFLYG